MKHGTALRTAVVLLISWLAGAPRPHEASAEAAPEIAASEDPKARMDATGTDPQPTCDDGLTDVPEVVAATARQLAARHIAYRSQPFSDCSGMFHRVLFALETRCGDVMGPTPDEARSSDAIARWYDEQGSLVRVSSPEQADLFLVPGAIVFFAPPSARNATDLDRIHHVGVVVDVERDEAGRVQSYRIFHGRQPGLTATITAHHTRTNYPPLGNGPDALVAIAAVNPQIAMAEPPLTEAWEEGEAVAWMR